MTQGADIGCVGLEMRDRRSMSGGRLPLLLSGPAVGVAAGVLTNLVTDGWNLWIIVGLTILTALLVAIAALSIDQHDAPAVRPGLDSRVTSLAPPAGTRVFTGRTAELRLLLR